MKKETEGQSQAPASPRDKVQSPGIASPSRRSFLGKLGTAATVTMAAGVVGAPSVLAESAALGSVPTSNSRVAHATALRIQKANADAKVNVPPHTTSGDEALYADKSASYSKGLLQDYIGVVNPPPGRRSTLPAKPALRTTGPTSSSAAPLPKTVLRARMLTISRAWTRYSMATPLALATRQDPFWYHRSTRSPVRPMEPS
jgi:hypothetical protein